ncbi:Ig-like domain-containing protein, partial [bacterium]|nr:Ig-like domain-containing protein [bacterium]
IAGTIPGTAEIWAESNGITQQIELKFIDPTKVGTISLRTGSASITADGASQVSIIATVYDAQGNTEPGATVTFKTSLGQFVEGSSLPGITNKTTTATTDVDGEATVMLVSGTTIGTATILAALDGLNTSATVIFIADEPKTISLRAAPSTIRPNGTSNVFATLLDINGNPVEGRTIVFSQQINMSEGALNLLSAVTNVNGEAQATYTAGAIPGADIVQAALSSDLGLKITTTIVVDPSAIVVDAINVTAGSPSLVADGASKVKIRAVVTDNEGNPAIGKIVTFTTTAGTLSSTTATTSDIGLAEVMLQSSTITGPVNVRAECDGFIDDLQTDDGEAELIFVPGPADHIILYAFPDVVPPNGAFKTAAIVLDQYENRLLDQRVNFLVREVGSNTLVDSVELPFDYDPETDDGVYRLDWSAVYGTKDLEITARVNNGVSETVTVDVDENATIVGFIDVAAGAEEIKADGTSSVLIRATVLDYKGAPAQGIMVDFATTLGTLSSAQKETDANGIADVMLKAETTWGTATVTADANGFWGEVPVRFTSLKAGGVSITAMPGQVVPGGQATIIAELRDTKGSPVPNEVLYFNVYENNSIGALSEISGITDTNGRVMLTYTAGVIVAIPGICDRIRVTLASDSSVTDTVCIKVMVATGTVGYITLESDAFSMPADGISSTSITAVVYDTAGSPMPEGTPITFTTDKGTFPGGVKDITLKTIDDSGTVITSLIAGTVGGVATIKAVSGSVSQVLNIIIDDGMITVGSIVLTADPTSIPADGASSTAITVLVTDTGGNPVPGGTPVILTTNLGSFVYPPGTPAPDPLPQSIALYTIGTTGTVTTSLISGLDAGEAWVMAMSGTLTQSTKVTFKESGTITTAEMFIDVTKRIIDATGSASSEIIVLLQDGDHNPIQDATVNFSTNLGTVTGSATTGTDGYAYVNGTNYPVLISAKKNGVATVTCWYGPKSSSYASAETDVVFAGVTLSVTADPDALSTAEMATVTATLKGPSGDPMADQEVLLETNIGKFLRINTGIITGDTQFSAKTDSSGNVSVKLSSSSAGIALVTGWHEPTKDKPGETSDTKEIVFTGYKLTMTPAQDSLVANGTEMAVVLTLEDEAAAPVANQVISLSTSRGHIDSSVMTDTLGQATATLISGTVIGVAKLTAIADLPDGSEITISAEVSFISGMVDRITLVADPSIIKINTGVSNIRAMVWDSSNNPVQGVNVAFTIIDAPGGGETITPVVVRTGSIQSGIPGQVNASFKAGSLGSTSINDVTIEASVGGITAATSLTITSNTSHISLGACTTTDCITDNGDGSYSIPISAVVSDINGISVPAGVAVTFSVGNANLGTIISPVSTDVEGRASTKLTYPATQAGNDIEIIASTSGVQQTEMIKLPSLNDNALADIYLSGPSSILGDGFTATEDPEIIAQAVDNAGNWVMSSVFFESSVTSDFTGDPAGTFINYFYWGMGQTNVEFVANPGTDEDNDPSNGFVSQDHDTFVRAYSGTIIKSNAFKIVAKGITLTVQPEKTTLLANGTSTTIVTAVLKETTTGLPIAGKTLNFAVTNGLIQGSATTDGSGTAKVMFTSSKSDVNTTAFIRCYYGSDIMASTEIELVPSADVSGIFASTDNPKLQNDPSQTAIITAQVLGPNGNPVEDGQAVIFEIISGPGQVEASATTGFVVDPDADPPIKWPSGIAKVTFTATPQTGTSVIRLSSGGLSTTIEIDIVEIGELVGAIIMTTGANSIPADGATQVLIRAKVIDIDGKSVSGIDVDFDTTLGSLIGATTVATDANGFAEVFLQSSTAPGTARVFAEADGFIETADVAFTSEAEIGYIELMSNPAEIPIGGSSAINAIVYDTAGNFMPVGTLVTFSVSSGLGTLSATSVVTVDSFGRAITTFQGTATGTATITATSGGVSQTATVQITADVIPEVGYITVTANPDTIPLNGYSAITAIVYDTAGQPMPAGTSVAFTGTSGTIAPTPVVTVDDSGTAITTFTGGTAGTSTITASSTSGGVTATQITTVRVTSEIFPTADSVSLSTTKTSIKTNGTDSATITALVLDASHVPINGATVNFISSGGVINAASVVTDANGEASIILKADPDKANGTITVTATVDVETAMIPIVMYGTVISIIPSSAQLEFDDTREIVIMAVDADSHPINDAAITITHNYDSTGSLFREDGNIVVNGTVLNTNYEGEIVLELTAGNLTAGTVLLNAVGLNTNAQGEYGIGDPSNIFQITAPESPDDVVPIPGSVEVTLHAGTLGVGDVVVFTTSFGTWEETGTQTLEYTIAAGDLDSGGLFYFVDRFLSSNQAGLATVQVYDKNNITTVDAVQISFYTPASQAYDIIIDASQTNIAPSTETSKNSVVIEANVVDINGNPVQGVTVQFSLSNTTGGGEYISPVFAVTDNSGIANTTFTSGTLSTGSDPVSAVQVTARVITPNVCTNEDTDITCAAHTPPGNDLDGHHFNLFQDGADYYVWYNDGGAVEPAIAGATGIEVLLNATNTAIQVANRTANAIDAVDGFIATSPGTTVNVLACGDVNDAGDGATDGSGLVGLGFAFTTTTQGTGTGPEWRTDTVSIVITGGVANVSIGYASAQTSSEDATLYLLPVSVLVADTNGNPIAGAVVSLGLMPSRFRTGYWKNFYNFLVGEKIWFIVYSN